MKYWKHLLLGFLFSILWVAFVVYLYSHATKAHKKSVREQALISAQITYEKDITTRRWAAMLGGVYAQVTDKLQPNPYLDVPKRDVTTTSGQKLTLINPAYMTRMIHALMVDEDGLKGHITSLNPIRPENAPKEWEVRALEKFHLGISEVQEEGIADGRPVLQYMRPMVVEKTCLKCHEKQGYKVGDIRGGISVTVPMSGYYEVSQAFQKTALERYTMVGLIGFVFLCVSLLLLLHHESLRNKSDAKQKKVESQLRKSEKKYRDLVEGTSNLVLRIDRKGFIVFANRFARQFFAIPDQPIESLNIVQMLSSDRTPTESPSSIEEINSFFGKGAGPHETLVPQSDGKPRWISWVVKKITNTDEDISELLCIGNDITDRHLANDRQREMEELFQGIATASRVAIIITDKNGNLSYANERMHDLTGLDTAGLADHGWMNQIHPNDKQSLQQDWFDNHSVTINQLEFRIISQNGPERWILGQIVELMGHARQTKGYVITLTNITQIKETESEHKQFTAAINHAAEAIIITDLNGDITYVNPAFEKHTGYSRQEVIGKNPRIMKSGEQSKEFYEELWETIRNGHVWTGQFINLKKDGQRYAMKTTICPVLDENGVLVSYVGVAHDISEQLLLEAQLRQAQKLESIGELAAGIAHEINTPTQYVSTNTQFLGESFATLLVMLKQCKQLVLGVQTKQDHDELLRLSEATLDEKELEYLAEEIPNALSESETGLKRIAEIVHSINQLAHPGEVNKKLHSLNEIVNNIVTVSKNEWKYVAKINLELDENLFDIQCLKGEIGQVILNLIINGSHAIEAKLGSNAEEKGLISIQTLQDEGWAVLKVTDTGTGMPKKVLDKIFDPFFTTKEVGKGTGQGLAITHNVVVTLHGGTIEVETTEGKGSTFTIKLPFRDKMLCLSAVK